MIYFILHKEQPHMINILSQVLLQTYIEYLRGKTEETKEINHHGKKIEINETTENDSYKIINVNRFVILTQQFLKIVTFVV